MFRRTIGCALLVLAWLANMAWGADHGTAALHLAYLDPAAAPADLDEVRTGARTWIPATNLTRAVGARWWRVELDPSADAGSDWIVALREAYGSRLVAYAPPDYRAQPLFTYDASLQQIGSRHRLAIQVPAEALDLPVYLELVQPRIQPIGVEAMPLAAYLAADLDRVRFGSAVLAVMLLLAAMAAAFAVALQRWVLLLFCAWVLSIAVYQMVIGGEIVRLAGDWLDLIDVPRLAWVTANLGLLAAYSFLFVLLDPIRQFPRLVRACWGILAFSLGMLLTMAVRPFTETSLLLLNILPLALSVVALGIGLARALAGERQAWLFLAGWSLVSVVSMTRAVYFMRGVGTPTWMEYLHPLANIVAALILVLVGAGAARHVEREMRSARRDAQTDPLTGVPNRLRLGQRVVELMQAPDRERRDLSVLFVDIDHFKQVNDRFGHDLGDRCLVAAADILRRHVRSGDLVARYGGEEFVLVLDDTDAGAARKVAQSLRDAMEREGRVVAGQEVGLTVSIGIAVRQPGDDAASLLKRADQALYRGKHEGRNRFVMARGDEVRA